MLKQWELFEKIPSGRTARNMRVSLNERGAFALNRKVLDKLGGPAFVELYFDKVNGLIGMKPVSNETKFAYPVRRQGKANSWLVRALAFLTHYNIKVKGTYLFAEPTIEDGMLVVDITKASQISARKSKPEASRQPSFVIGKAN